MIQEVHMDVTITTRHCTIPDALRDRTTRRVAELERFHPRAASATVLFSEEHGRKQCEARIKVARGAPLVASATGGSFRGALDAALDRLERQLKRHRERRRRRRDSVVETA